MIESKDTRRERHVAYMGQLTNVTKFKSEIMLGRYSLGDPSQHKDNIRCLLKAYVTRAWTSFV